MSCLENDKLCEKAYEIFRGECDRNPLLTNLIHDTYDQWTEIEHDRPCEEAYDQVFDHHWKEDMEAMCRNPISTIILRETGKQIVAAQKLLDSIEKTSYTDETKQR